MSLFSGARNIIAHMICGFGLQKQLLLRDVVPSFANLKQKCVAVLNFCNSSNLHAGCLHNFWARNSDEIEIDGIVDR